ncbi:hypothetical protein LMG6001_03193 [Achromobacter insolitus]|uniref:nuclear transport factor 2 family protein n=1 Tax=Achromobacter insolitus TaxID=217204 RepID=UPI00097278E4|nr:nuclear transport factor 2 family protein [Achromobacter insolitus]APX75604.1 hypothetical protein BUW96_12450 [Achromobacter insolitus]OWT59775.1 hypothetical protein CEY08_17045 [Achromobacter insolitus]CAB3704190.1 hypothetical protein LMG6003_02773 [Achromobacter insolitus]CAB3953141.1 hypothetical protein LMG6001_03193 [Achromobacter insolitus]VEG67168.1 SnoaL-like domain [Achromobacter insolitus]
MKSVSSDTQGLNSINPLPLGDTHADVEAACARLCIEFANALDGGDYSRVMDVFTPDAVIVTPTNQVVHGREAILASLRSRPPMVTRHLCSNIRVTLNGDGSATGLCYVVCFKAFGVDATNPVSGTPAPIVADYHDTYVRTAQGWRIRERRIAIIFEPE